MSATLARKLEEMNDSLSKLNAEIEKATDEKQRLMLCRVRESLERIRDASRPDAPRPTADEAERLMGDVFLVRQIAQAHNIKPSVC